MSHGTASAACRAQPLPRAATAESITRLDPKLWRWAERAANREESWADDVHFDFPQPFDASAAAAVGGQRR